MGKVSILRRKNENLLFLMGQNQESLSLNLSNQKNHGFKFLSATSLFQVLLLLVVFCVGLFVGYIIRRSVHDMMFFSQHGFYGEPHIVSLLTCLLFQLFQSCLVEGVLAFILIHHIHCPQALVLLTAQTRFDLSMSHLVLLTLWPWGTSYMSLLACWHPSVQEKLRDQFG